jgi:hypothetical protein
MKQELTFQATFASAFIFLVFRAYILVSSYTRIILYSFVSSCCRSCLRSPISSSFLSPSVVYWLSFLPLDPRFAGLNPPKTKDFYGR